MHSTPRDTDGDDDQANGKRLQAWRNQLASGIGDGQDQAQHSSASVEEEKEQLLEVPSSLSIANLASSSTTATETEWKTLPIECEGRTFTGVEELFAVSPQYLPYSHCTHSLAFPFAPDSLVLCAMILCSMSRSCIALTIPM